MPVVALMLFLPKVLKAKLANRPKKEKPTKQPKQKEEKPEPALQAKPQVAATPSLQTGQANDFQDYAEIKRRRVSAPKRNEPKLKDFPSFESHFRPPIFTQPKQKPKSIAEEINSLSPELKALIISGALEKRDFDDFNN